MSFGTLALWNYFIANDFRLKKYDLPKSVHKTCALSRDCTWIFKFAIFRTPPIILQTHYHCQLSEPGFTGWKDALDNMEWRHPHPGHPIIPLILVQIFFATS